MESDNVNKILMAVLDHEWAADRDQRGAGTSTGSS